MPDLSLLLPMLALLIVIGGIAGVIAGLLGVGAALFWCLRSSSCFPIWAMAGHS